MTSPASFGGSFDTQKNTIVVVYTAWTCSFSPTYVHSIVMTFNVHEIRQEALAPTVHTLVEPQRLFWEILYAILHSMPRLNIRTHHCHSLQNVCMKRGTGSVLAVSSKHCSQFVAYCSTEIVHRVWFVWFRKTSRRMRMKTGRPSLRTPIINLRNVSNACLSF